MKFPTFFSLLFLVLLSQTPVFAQYNQVHEAGFQASPLVDLSVVNVHKGKNIFSTKKSNVQVAVKADKALQIEKVFLLRNGKAHKMKLKRDSRYHYKDFVIGLSSQSGVSGRGRQKNRRVEMEVVFE